MIKVDLTGKRVGKLVVTGYSHNHPKHKYVKFWKCKCDCGNEKIVRGSHLYNNAIKSCGCLHRRTGKDCPAFGGYEEISGDFMSIIRRGAKSRGHEFSITIEYLWKLFESQKRKCALSGMPLSFGDGRRTNCYAATSKRTASLDRIDSARGYIEGNVQWVHKCVNLMKQDLPEADFILWCNRITRHIRGKNFHLQKRVISA